MQEWLAEHMLISYLLIVGFTIYIFNAVFRPVKRLPILKEIAVYVTIAIGSLILLILQVDRLPIIQCMAGAVALMLILRLRQLYDKWRKGREQREAAADRPDGGTGSGG
jgi:prepilin signal peptidase PulO-like enzyme (type II secretory pathway)